MKRLEDEGFIRRPVALLDSEKLGLGLTAFVLFKTQQTWVPNPLEGLKNIALQAGFTEDSFMACLNNKDIGEKILAVRNTGDSLGVQGIPTFFINGERYQGEYTFEAMKVEIDKLLG